MPRLQALRRRHAQAPSRGASQLALVAALAAVALLVGFGLRWWSARAASNRPASPFASAVPALPASARQFDTVHYRIATTAGDADTRRVGDAVESLHAAYAAFFPQASATAPTGRLSLVLYRDQAEFKRFNRSKSWAEAYYLAPSCYAYYGAGQANPYHWMLHEATHQLNDRMGRWPRRNWSNEALATYFGTSRIVEGKLRPGEIDPDTYPVWWLPRMELSGNLDEDLARQRVIPLRRLIEDPGPPDGSQVNRYYLGYWSLAHYLLRANHGEHAAGFRKVLAEGSTLAAFERHIGPVERVQLAWYRYLRDDLAAGSQADAIIVEL